VRRTQRGLCACIALLGVVVTWICPHSVTALSDPPGDDRMSASLWREVGHPGQRRARDLLRQALLQEREASRQLPSDWPGLCRRAMSPGFGDESLTAIRGRTRALRELARQAVVRRARLDSAIVRLQLASRLAPGDPEILYALARVLIKWEEPGPLWRCSARRRDDEAIAVLEDLRRRQPQYAQSAVAFDLAIVLTRASRFAEAAQIYGEAIALALDPAEAAVMRSNLAEVTMLSGDVESAIVHYERALRAAGGGRDYLLPLWGLAVALDRLGEHDAALEQAGKAVHAEGGRMAVLRSDGVFFEPEHEIHYYEALGHEALAARPEADVARELAAAAASWRSFAAAAGDDGPFAAAARANLERAERELRAARDKRPKYGPRTTQRAR
jgi:tetratricopeptide (TPR) repeat protein